MPRPRARDKGSSLPVGFGGQNTLCAMWSWPAGSQGIVGNGMWSQDQQQPMGTPGGMAQQHMVAAMMRTMMPPPGAAMVPPTPSGSVPPGIIVPALTAGEPEPSLPPLTNGNPVASEQTRTPDDPSFPDDDQRLSTSYRALGCVFKHGVRATIPKKLRASVAMSIDSNEWSVFRLANIDEHEMDMLLFILTGVPPTTRICDLNVKNKGELRRALAKEGLRVLKTQPERTSSLAHDLSNLEVTAKRLGYKEEWLPPTKAETEEPRGTKRGIADPARVAFATMSKASSSTSSTMYEPPSLEALGPRKAFKVKTSVSAAIQTVPKEAPNGGGVEAGDAEETASPIESAQREDKLLDKLEEARDAEQKATEECLKQLG